MTDLVFAEAAPPAYARPTARRASAPRRSNFLAGSVVLFWLKTARRCRTID
jgi:hypothetical protein